MDKSKKRIVSMFVVVILVVAAGMYLFSYSSAIGVDDYLISRDGVAVSETHYGLFFDGAGTDDILIFYPGAKVEYTAYAPLLFELAKGGLDVALVKMPCNMAIFGVSEADKIPEAENYAHVFVGGHSMGGAMAAAYASMTERELSGLVFYAAYSATDITEKALPVLSLYGEFDKVLNMSKLAEGRALVGDKYEEVCISGGNHAYFGSYGEQKGDGEATITPKEQMKIAAEETLRFVKSVA